MSIIDDDNRLLGEAGYTGSYSDKINEALESSTGIRGATPDLWMKLFDDLGIPDGALPNRKLAYLQTLGATSNVLTQAIREVLGLGLPSVAVARNFLTFGGINESGTIPAWSPTGDFEVELDISTTNTLNAAPLGTSNNLLCRVTTTGALDWFVGDGAGFTVFLTGGGSAVVNDGKLRTVKLTKVGTTYTSTVDGSEDQQVVTAGVSAPSLQHVGDRDGLTERFPGTISNISLTDTAGGDNRFYPMSSGSTTTEPDTLGSGATDMTLNNIVAGDWELFTQVQKEISRAALTFGGVNESGGIPAWTAAGDFRVEDQVQVDLNTFQVAGSSNASWIGMTSSGELSVRVNGVIKLSSGLGLVADGKLHSRVVERVGSTLTATWDGVEVINTTATGDFILDITGAASGPVQYYSGVHANLSLTEAGGDNRFYAMISGSTTTEPDTLGDGSTDMTLNNIVADDWGTIVTQPFKWVGNVTSTVIEGPQS